MLVERLLRFAETRSSRPALLYQTTGDLLMVFRYRERLSQGFRVLIGEAELVEHLTDKAQFHALAECLAHPVLRAASAVGPRVGAVQRALRPRPASVPT